MDQRPQPARSGPLRDTPGRTHADVVVVGGGLAGLAAGATAARAGAAVVVLDAHGTGGRARSTARDGYVFNQGPHALYRRGPGAEVLGELGVRPTGAPPARVVHGLQRGKVLRLPTSLASLLRSGAAAGWSGRARLGVLLARASRIDTAALAGQSAANWVASLGLPEDAAAVVRTFVRVASYAPDLDAISADAAVRQLQLVVTGGVVYLDGGWSRLVDGLEQAATSAGARVSTGDPALRVEPADAGGWRVVSSSTRWETTSVVVAVGSPAAAAALLPLDPGWPSAPDATAACLDLGLRRPPPTRVLFDLERPLYLSTHAPAAALAPPGGSTVHVMRYGARTSEIDRAELRQLAQAAGVAGRDVVVERFLHRMVVVHAQPQPGRGLEGRPGAAVPGCDGVFVAGDWVGPVGLLADAALASGRAAGSAAAARARCATPGGAVARAGVPVVG